MNHYSNLTGRSKMRLPHSCSLLQRSYYAAPLGSCVGVSGFHSIIDECLCSVLCLGSARVLNGQSPVQGV